jgi:3-hydroxyanthranilate 3,4-dioxygenase
MKKLSTIPFQKWIDEHRALLKPPVGNQLVWEDREFMVTVVGGPNSRTDYHVNEGEEFFYQLEGNIVLKIMDRETKAPYDLPILEGEIFLLPPNTPHSPQRPAGSIGLVIERRRLSHEKDSFLWFCRNCHHLLYSETLHVTNLVTELPPIFSRFYGNAENRTCKKCGTIEEPRS